MHTQGELIIESGFTSKDDPRFFLGVKGNQLIFITTQGNDEANAKHLLKCWNSHDELLAACKVIQRCLKCKYGFLGHNLFCPTDADKAQPNCSGYVECYPNNITLKRAIENAED